MYNTQHYHLSQTYLALSATLWRWRTLCRPHPQNRYSRRNALRQPYRLP
ncbi:TPA: hypothetical protein MNH60_001963 [Citrobacter farmeri]|nr:hypothetical protein [Citrobacter farmeri]HBZ9726992.1 hypothetical protein [Citrobacter farmeri]HCA0086822.1 hypothetical protein [Citrobacter farmeri]HCA0345828.1 hypothetical protein [Citrobacter farmeri]HCA0591739.1 hypothetical protein [Citrobacter farmeri]